MSRRTLTVAVLIVAVITAQSATIGAQERAVGFGHSSATLPVSAVALATVVLQKSAGTSELDLLIVWRGSPGWFLKGNSQSGSSGGSATGFGASMSRGGVDLNFHLIYQPRPLKIQSVSVELGAHNVVLVDDVDSSQGPKVLSVLSVGRDAITDPKDVATALGRSPEVVAFLKCGVELESPMARAATERVCKEIGR